MKMRSNALCLAALVAVPGIATAQDVVVDKLIDIPAPLEEVITTRPTLENVWVPGSWERTPDKWTWIKGHWETPPNKAAHWQNGEWGWTAGKWHWRPGHWAVEDVSWIVTEPLDIPLALNEVKPPKPSDKNHWVAGHWDWDAGWNWIPGYYTNKPHPDASWVPGHWEPYGVDGYWWMGGHWQVK